MHQRLVAMMVYGCCGASARRTFFAIFFFAGDAFLAGADFLFGAGFLAMITGGFEVLAMRFNSVVPHARGSQHRT